MQSPIEKINITQIEQDIQFVMRLQIYVMCFIISIETLLSLLSLKKAVFQSLKIFENQKWAADGV